MSLSKVIKESINQWNMMHRYDYKIDKENKRLSNFIAKKVTEAGYIQFANNDPNREFAQEMNNK